jgi:hypothetical protein
MKCITLLVLIVGILINRPLAHAARIEKAMGVGLTFFSGNESSYVSPDLSPHVSFSANILKKRINFVNHFEFGYMSSGKNFGGSLGTYSGYFGIYELATRFNLAKESIQPYLEIGPTIGMFAVTASGATGTQSKNQTSFKYGYTVGTGFDWLESAQRGESNGWGIGFNYFYYFKSPSNFEFPAAKLAVQGVKFEFRYIFQPAK